MGLNITEDNYQKAIELLKSHNRDTLSYADKRKFDLLSKAVTEYKQTKDKNDSTATMVNSNTEIQQSAELRELDRVEDMGKMISLPETKGITQADIDAYNSPGSMLLYTASRLFSGIIEKPAWGLTQLPFLVLGDLAKWSDENTIYFDEKKGKWKKTGPGYHSNSKERLWYEEMSEYFGKPEEHAPISRFAEKGRKVYRKEAYNTNYFAGLVYDMADTGVDILSLIIQMKFLNKLSKGSVPTLLPTGVAKKGITLSQAKSMKASGITPVKPSLSKVPMSQAQLKAYKSSQLTDTVNRLTKLGAHAYLTTPGEHEDRFQAGVMRVAYNVTPYIVAQTPLMNAPAVMFDLALNSMLTAPQYINAYQQAGGFNQDFLTMAIPQLLTDVVMSWSTRGDATMARNGQLTKYFESKFGKDWKGTIEKLTETRLDIQEMETGREAQDLFIRLGLVDVIDKIAFDDNNKLAPLNPDHMNDKQRDEYKYQIQILREEYGKIYEGFVESLLDGKPTYVIDEKSINRIKMAGENLKDIEKEIIESSKKTDTTQTKEEVITSKSETVKETPKPTETKIEPTTEPVKTELQQAKQDLEEARTELDKSIKSGEKKLIDAWQKRFNEEQAKVDKLEAPEVKVEAPEPKVEPNKYVRTSNGVFKVASETDKIWKFTDGSIARKSDKGNSETTIDAYKRSLSMRTRKRPDTGVLNIKTRNINEEKTPFLNHIQQKVKAGLRTNDTDFKNYRIGIIPIYSKDGVGIDKFIEKLKGDAPALFKKINDGDVEEYKSGVFFDIDKVYNLSNRTWADAEKEEIEKSVALGKEIESKLKEATTIFGFRMEVGDKVEWLDTETGEIHKGSVIDKTDNKDDFAQTVTIKDDVSGVIKETDEIPVMKYDAVQDKKIKTADTHDILNDNIHNGYKIYLANIVYQDGTKFESFMLQSEENAKKGIIDVHTDKKFPDKELAIKEANERDRVKVKSETKETDINVIKKRGVQLNVIDTKTKLERTAEEKTAKIEKQGELFEVSGKPDIAFKTTKAPEPKVEPPKPSTTAELLRTTLQQLNKDPYNRELQKRVANLKRQQKSNTYKSANNTASGKVDTIKKTEKVSKNIENTVGKIISKSMANKMGVPDELLNKTIQDMTLEDKQILIDKISRGITGETRLSPAQYDKLGDLLISMRIETERRARPSNIEKENEFLRQEVRTIQEKTLPSLRALTTIDNKAGIPIIDTEHYKIYEYAVNKDLLDRPDIVAKRLYRSEYFVSSIIKNMNNIANKIYQAENPEDGIFRMADLGDKTDGVDNDFAVLNGKGELEETRSKSRKKQDLNFGNYILITKNTKPTDKEIDEYAKRRTKAYIKDITKDLSDDSDLINEKKLVKQWEKHIMHNIIKKEGDIAYKRFRRGMLIQRIKTDMYKSGISHDLRNVLPFVIQKTGIPEEMKEIWGESLYNSRVKGMNKHSEKLEAIAERVRNFNQMVFKEAVDVWATLSDKEKDNYVGQLWYSKDKRKKGGLNSFFITSPFFKKRFFESYADGIKEGLIPKTTDIFDILRIVDESNSRAIANKQFADVIKNMKDETGNQLWSYEKNAPADWVKVDHWALRVPKFSVEGFQHQKISKDIISTLKDIGVRIVRKAGIDKSLGEFKDNEITIGKITENKVLAHEIGHAIADKIGFTDTMLDRYEMEAVRLVRDRLNEAEAISLDALAYAISKPEVKAEVIANVLLAPDNAMQKAPELTIAILNNIKSEDTLKSLVDNVDWSKATQNINKAVNKVEFIPVYWNPHIAKKLNIVFGKPYDLLKVAKIWKSIFSTSKGLVLKASMFHPTTMTEGSLAIDIKGLGELINPVNIYNFFIKGTTPVHNKEGLRDYAERSIKKGLVIGDTGDYSVHTLQSLLNAWEMKASKYPLLRTFVKTLNKANKLSDDFLWQYIQPTLKVHAFKHWVETLEKNDKIKNNPALLDAMEKTVAQTVNDVFGGQNWQILGSDPRVVQVANMLMLSPDFNISILRQALLPFGFGDLSKKVDPTAFGIKPESKDALELEKLSKKMRTRLGLSFWANAIVKLGIGFNLLNALNRRIDMENNPEFYEDEDTNFGENLLDYTMFGNAYGKRTFIFTGRNSDGSERYAGFGKQFRDIFKLFHDGNSFNPVNATINSVGSKADFGIQALTVAFTGHTLGAYKTPVADAKGWDKVVKRGREMLRFVTPIGIQHLIDPNLEFSPYRIAVPVSSVSEGYISYMFADAYESMIRKQIKTGKSVDPSEDRMLKEVYKAGRLQGYDVGLLNKRGQSIAEGRMRRELLESYNKEIEEIWSVLSDRDKRGKLTANEISWLTQHYRALKKEQLRLSLSYDRWAEVLAETKKGLIRHRRLNDIMDKTKK